MKKQYIAACMAGVAGLGLGSMANADVVFQNAATAEGTGNQSGFVLGMNFNVACPMTVTSLGTFDNNLTGNGGNTTATIAQTLMQGFQNSGLLADIQVAIYNTATGLPVTPIVDFTAAGAAAYYNPAGSSSIFQHIAAVTLPVGNYAIEAGGYFQEGSGGFLSGNTQLGSSPTPVFATLGALTLGKATYSGPGGNTPLLLPGNINVPPQNNGTPPPETPLTGPQLLAGTFEATCNCGPGVPDGGTTLALLGVALTGIAGLSRKLKS